MATASRAHGGRGTVAARREWDGDRVDLAAYLSRIGHHGHVEPDAATLTRLHRAHVTAIPFENLDVILGRPIALDVDRLQDKLVRAGRGGYCYEHNLLFAAVLERLGYSVTGLVGRLRPPSGPRTHMALSVEADGKPWLADVGFGDVGLLEAIPLSTTGPVRQGGWIHRLDGLGRDARLLRARAADRWRDLYTFTMEAHRPRDYAVYNHYTSTSPHSPFVTRVIAQRTTATTRRRLLGRRLVTTHADGTVKERELVPDQVPAVLDDVFGIRLTPHDAATLVQRTTALGPAPQTLVPAPQQGGRQRVHPSRT